METGITKNISFLIFFILFLFAVNQNSNAKIYTINNVINGAQEVPVVITSGTGTITGTFNDVTNVLAYSITFSGLTGTTSAGHFHGPAAVGSNAGVVIAYSTLPLGVTSGTFSGSNTLTATQKTQLLSGLWYSNIHTTFKPGGEIRGQVTPIPLTLNLTVLPEGLFNSGTNTTVRDTIRVFVRNSTFPYAVVDTGKSYFSTTGVSNIELNNAVTSANYYLQIIHRNSVETWSSAFINFSALSNPVNYNFTDAANKAFGDNQKLSGTKYCLYSGETNSDGIVDASDLSDIDNNIDLSGYNRQDLNGDDYVDGSDLGICDNNQGIFSVTP
jgi:hypothetical protein